jgi:predicted dehydrogenase
MCQHFNRRSFLVRGMAAGTAFAGAPYVYSPRQTQAQRLSANEGLGVLAIGVRGRGAAVAVGSCEFGRVVACCDVDTASRDKFSKHLAEVQAEKPAFYGDYRKALEHPGVDVVTIGTPDHWHTKILIDAVRACKDVYVEKPMSLTIDEGKIVCDVVKETGRVVQVGTQQRSEYDGIFLKMVALARGGRLGPKLTATVKLPSQYGKDVGPFAITEPPTTLDWDMWLGQVPLLPYCARRCHGSWRNWVETGYGPLSDWGVHHVDIAQWAIGAENTGPVEVEGKGVWPQGREATLAVLLGERPPTSLANGYSTVTDYHAELRFANGNTIKIIALEKPWESGRHRVGTEVVGGEGRIWASRGGPNFELRGQLIDEIHLDNRQSEELTESAIKLYKGKTPQWGESTKRIGDIVPTTHMRNFVDCVRDRSEPISDVWTHHRAMTSCLLANISMLVDRKLTWDPDKQEIVGDEEANALLSRQQRPPYTINGSI